MSEESQGQSQPTSKYNSAVAQLQRIDALWQKAHTSASSGNYLLWNITLDKIWAELAGDISENDSRIKQFYAFTEKLGNAGLISREEIKGFAQPKSQGKGKQYIILLEKEVWLRRLQNSQGKGTAYADEFEDDFD